MPQKLSPEQVAEHLKALPEWSTNGDTIQRIYTLTSFPAAVMFVGAVGHLAEAANHHPDILVQWKDVTITLSTHSADGVTELDFALAEKIDGLPFKEA